MVATVIACIAGVALGSLTTLGVAHSDPPPPSAAVKIPYVVSVFNQDGPVTGTSEIFVRVFDSAQNGATLLYEERFESVPIFAGELGITIGTGIPLSGQLGIEEVMANPDIAVELAVDDTVIASRQRMGSVARSATARSVPASGILFGGEHGLVPASAITRPIIVETEVVASGSVLAPPEGYMCLYQTRLPGFQSPIEGTLDQLSGSDMWISFAGDVTLDLSKRDPWKGLQTGTQPFASTPTEIHAQHLSSPCSSIWLTSCSWEVAELSTSVEVTSTCVAQGI